MFTDSETGEYVNCTISPNSTPGTTTEPSALFGFNLETGESESRPLAPAIRKRRTFSVPRKLLAQPEETKNCCIDLDENYTLSGKEQVITLQEVSFSYKLSRLCYST